ncbi:cupin domain-containing protein [Halobium salinum]|uniref:Cupin domain-containing protein n=1 Tax=Halobium salinum TaxID=1364940 RepID=A0ABD5P9J5_9EURY|nr:cupin domain-containing protein [Halobium salinum]
MEKVSVDDVEETNFAGVSVSRLSDPLGTEDLAINHYDLAPGDSFSAGMHTHLDQEELFYVISGTATFETRDGEVEVGAGEAIRFARGDYQSGRNDAEVGADGEHVVALALGAPKGSTEMRVPQPCPECGDSDELAVFFAEDGFTLRCPTCGAEFDA